MAIRKCCIFEIVLGICVQTWTVTTCLNSSELNLHKKLFTDYNPNVMPQENKLTPVNVTLDMYLMSIDNIDEKRQTITIKAFLEIKWRDAFLTWNPDDYPGVSRISVKDSDIWVPDIALQDTFDKLSELGQGDGKANIKSDGLVTIWPYKIYTVACKIFIGKFPFDRQSCEFDFLSWSHPTSILVLNSSQKKPDMSRFSESGEWDLTSSEVKMGDKTYGDDTWDHVYISLKLKRKSLYHVVNLILPVLCISILNIVSFSLPARSGERITLCISIFLTLAVFLTTVNNHMPESSDEVASFSVYLGLQLLGSAFTIMFTIISLYLYHRGKCGRLPGLLKGLVKICRVSRSNEHYQAGKEIPDESSVNCMNNVTNEQVKITKECGHATWRMVSLAMDKLCLIFAICWHIVLTVSLFVSVNS